MSISFVDHVGISGYSVAVPASVQDGDIIIWQGGYGGTASARLPETFTNIDVRTSGSTSWQRVAWRIACDDDGVTHSCQQYTSPCSITAFRHTAGAWTKPSLTGMWSATTTTSRYVTCPSITPLTAYDVIVACFYKDATITVTDTPDGWSHAGYALYSTSGRLDTYYRISGTTDEVTGPTLTFSGGTNAVATILVLSEVPTPTNEIMAGYNKRVKAVIDSTKVRADLHDYPFLISLSNSSGTGSTDCSDIFNTIGSDYTKIAVTTGDGITQIPVEVERWDDTNGYARLWAKVPYVSCTEDTEVYVYYDEEASSNSQYVGLAGSVVGASVFDDVYQHVWHLNNDPSGGTDCIIDSCGKKDGTPYGTMLTEDLIEGPIPGSQAIDFDGSNDWILFAAGANTWDMQGDKYWSMECIVNPDNISAEAFYMIMHMYYNNSNVRAGLRCNTSALLGTWMAGAVSAYDLNVYSTGLTLSDDTWQYCATEYSGFIETAPGWYRNQMFLGGTGWEKVSDGTSYCSTNITYGISVGGYGSNKYDYALGEVRLASRLQPHSWYEVNYASLFDTLNAYTMQDVSPPVPNMVLDGEMLIGDEWKVVKNGTKRTVAGTYMLRRGIWRPIVSTVEE